MTAADYARLVALGAIWGASFMFQRIVVPELGPVLTAETRVLFAGLALALWFRLTGFDPQWRRHWKPYLVIGVNNSALPFVLLAFGALHLPASLLSILNASAPIFGAAFGALWLGERLSRRRMLGLACGLAGVALVSRPGLGEVSPLFGWAVAAGLAACLCYGLTGIIVKRYAAGTPSRGIAVGSQIAAALVLAPLVPFTVPSALPSTFVVANAAVLALLCGAVAYLLYFRLLADVGATRALTVTYLVPVFGILWGSLFLGETLTASMAAGGAMILAGVVLVTRG
ncbi:MAG: DMT family transporter [Burkholderiales bacterium]